MKPIQFLTLLIFLCLFTEGRAEGSDPHLSLKLEVKRAIKLGNSFLAEERKGDGSWSDDEHPALTALALTALMRDPNLKPALSQEMISESYQWLLQQQKEDGGIYREGLATYNTATSIMALVAKDEGKYRPAILKARAYLVGLQTDWGAEGQNDNPYDGGIGYGGTYKHSDMSNTHLALEAIYHTRHLAHDGLVEEQDKLDWESARTFINRCQNLTATNDQEWASDDSENKGGFVYFPGDSKAGEKPLKGGVSALRSYGSMSYAGLLSLIFTDLSPDDIRLESVLEWLGDNYSVEENPGLGQQGLYYYYQAMAKSLAASGQNYLVSSNGEKIDWRRELGTKLVNLQGARGAWSNETSRWWENDRVLVTAYAVLALEQLYQTM